MSCVFLCLSASMCFSMEGYGKGSEDSPHQSPTQKEIGRRMEDRKRDGGRQEAASAEEERGRQSKTG